MPSPDRRWRCEAGAISRRWGAGRAAVRSEAIGTPAYRPTAALGGRRQPQPARSGARRSPPTSTFDAPGRAHKPRRSSTHVKPPSREKTSLQSRCIAYIGALRGLEDQLRNEKRPGRLKAVLAGAVVIGAVAVVASVPHWPATGWTATSPAALPDAAARGAVADRGGQPSPFAPATGSADPVARNAVAANAVAANAVAANSLAPNAVVPNAAPANGVLSTVTAPTALPSAPAESPQAVSASYTAGPAAAGSAVVVTYRKGKLAVAARDASVSEILARIGKSTGAVVDAPDIDQRVTVQLGPRPPAQVMADLLQGLHLNYALLAGAGKGRRLEAIIVFPESGSGPQGATSLEDAAARARARAERHQPGRRGDDGVYDDSQGGR